MEQLYNIVRFYHNSDRRKIIHHDVTLSVAQLHCKDPRTKKEGVWFDGYVKSRMGEPRGFNTRNEMTPEEALDYFHPKWRVGV